MVLQYSNVLAPLYKTVTGGGSHSGVQSNSEEIPHIQLSTYTCRHTVTSLIVNNHACSCEPSPVVSIGEPVNLFNPEDCVASDKNVLKDIKPPWRCEDTFYTCSIYGTSIAILWNSPQ